MTVASSVARVSYSGNGSTTAFSVPFYFLEDGHLRVIIRAANGTETVQTITTDYTVAGAGNSAGGTVTMNTAPASGESLVILRNVPLTQTTDYQANDPFPAESHERALDKLTMISQQDQETLDRALKYPETETGAPTLPTSVARAGAYLAFDNSGNPIAGAKGDDITTLAAVTTDIARLADIEDGTLATDAIQTVSGISGNVTTVAGISGNVTAVAGNATNINTVAGDLTGDDDIGTVATNIANVQAVAGDISNVNAVAADATDIGTVATDLAGSDTIGTVAGSISNVNSVATNIANVNTVSSNISSINAVVSDLPDIITVADDLNEAVSEIETVADNIAVVQNVGADLTGSPIVVDYGDLTAAENPATPTGAIGAVYAIRSDIQTVAGIDTDVTTVSGISSNVTSVAGNQTNINTVAGISANVTTVAGISSDVSSVAAIDSDVSSVAAIDSDVSIVASNVADVTNFADVYQGPKSTDPALRNDGSALQVGDLYFNTVIDKMKNYTSTGWDVAYVPTSDFLVATNNLSDLDNAATARTNLGLSDFGDLT